MERKELRPIFLVGCPRSGTTLLRLVLDSHPSISCGPETHLVGPMQQMLARWPSLRLFGFDREYWYEKMAAFLDSFQSEYAAGRGRARWADKTPEYCLRLDFINELFPSCQVIHLIRDGRHVVASHRDTWGYKAALSAIEKWPRFVRAGREGGSRMDPGRYHEIRYEDLVNDAEPTLRALFDFLGEPWDDVVMAYDSVPHDNYTYFDIVANLRREANRDDSLIYRSRSNEDQARLDPLLGTLFRVWAGDLHRQLGYS